MELDGTVLRSIVTGKGEVDEHKSTYDLLHTDQGKHNAHIWFIKQAGHQHLDEDSLTEVFRGMTNLSDSDILDILDIFDADYAGVLSWKRFHLLLAAYCALASRQTVKFLYNHGDEVFACLKREYPKSLTFQEFASFSLVFGIKEEDLVRAILSDFKVNPVRLREQPLSQQDFVVYYYPILEKIDQTGTISRLGSKDFAKTSALCGCTIS